MKASSLVEVARTAGLGGYGKIKYDNDYPNNVMKYHYAEKYWTCDCLGFVHTMINGFCGNIDVLGGGAYMDDFVNYSDEKTTIYKYCTDISDDFYDILAGEILYMHGHVGLYIGECEPFGDGRKFNVAECCYSSFGGGGMLTWVDSDGTRRNHKNGSTAGAWELHGKCARVEYDIPQNETVEETDKKLTPQDILNLVNETFAGVYGNNPDRQHNLTNAYDYETYRKVQDILNIIYR